MAQSDIVVRFQSSAARSLLSTAMDASHTIVVLAPRDADAHALIARMRAPDIPWRI